MIDMNKILIPSILTATILIAGIFAIVDVDRVMAGHLPSLGAVGSAAITDNSIVSADIQAGTIVSADLNAAAAITSGQILDGTLVSADLSNAAALTSAQILDGEIVSADLAGAAAITSGQILDDTIGPEDVTGVGAATGLIRVEELSSDGANDLDTVTTAFTPIVVSTALVICNASGVESGTGADPNPTMTLSDDNGASVVQGTAARPSDPVLNTGQWAATNTWIVTAISTDATIFTCTMGGGLEALDVDTMDINAIFFPS